jgi:hypothetical protein
MLFALLVAAVLSVSSLKPASAGPTFTSGSIIAILFETGVSEFQVSDLGTVPFIACFDVADNFLEREICDECFAVCVSREFEMGACGTTGVNLLPSLPGPSLHRPFYFKKGTTTPVFLTAVPSTSPPRYDLAQAPRGAEVFVITDNKPTGGKCVGVRTSFSFFRGSCKLCKTRKYYNTCTRRVNITGIHEWEQPCEEAVFSSSGLNAFAQDDDEILRLWAVGNSGANPPNAVLPHIPSEAGSVGLCAIDFDTGGFIGPCDFFSCSCGATSGEPGEGGPGSTFMEVCLSFLPGGVPLAPVGKPGYEKFVKFCFDITPIVSVE